MSQAQPSYQSPTLGAMWPPPDTHVLDNSGRPVDITGRKWPLHDPLNPAELDWDQVALTEGSILNTARRYFIWQIARNQPISVRNTFSALLSFWTCPAVQHASATNSVIPYAAFSEHRQALGRKNQYRLHYTRDFYRWACAQGHPNFSREVLVLLNEVTIGGNEKGQAVRSASPKKGPLNEMEQAALKMALRTARDLDSIPIALQAMVWISYLLGPNAGQIAALREEDLICEKIDDDVVAYILRVPRHKKGQAGYRVDFRERRIHRFVGKLIEDLIALNQQYLQPNEPESIGRPLFRRDRPAYDIDHPLAQWRWHLTSFELSDLVQSAADALDLRARDGQRLRLTPRRCRYTMGNRLILNGASAHTMMDAFDHSDLQQIPVYFDVSSGIIDALGTRLAEAIAPYALALTTIVATEQEAERGDHLGSRCFFGDPDKGIFEPVGTCGSHRECHIHGPLSCYVCHRFQAWLDGPHEQVLEFLLRQRDQRIENGLPAKLVESQNDLIAAVASVVARIRKMENDA